MILPRSYASCLVLGALVAAPLTISRVRAGDFADDNPVNQISDHCAQFGTGFVDVGHGTCGRVSGHVRVYVRTQNAAMNGGATPWPSSGTSNAALSSDTMIPSGEVTHLRVRGSLDSNPFH